MSPSSSSLSSTPTPTTTTPITTNVFDVGKYTTLLPSAEPNTCTTKSSLSLPPPKPLLIAIPDVAGEFPLLLLLHGYGYLLYDSFYSQLIRHIASHGFIAVAPQVPRALVVYAEVITEKPRSSPKISESEIKGKSPKGKRDLTKIKIKVLGSLSLSLEESRVNSKLEFIELYTVAGPYSTVEIKSAVAITYWLPSGLHKVLPTHVQPNLTKIRLSGHNCGGKAAFALALGKVTTPSLNFQP
ncbi:unnamed protein product [Camellia sinensis]